MKKVILFICLCFSINLYSQIQPAHKVKVKVEIELNSFMCPNLNMKIKRTLFQRKNEISEWKVSADYGSAEFLVSNPLLCNKDSIIKIFVKESEFPMHIIRTIQIDDNAVYKRANTN